MTDRLYFKFQSIVEDAQIRLNVDRDALALLDVIASCADEGLEPLSVTEAMSLKEIASPATIHRKLNLLVAANLVTHEYRDNNRRIKYLLPTAKARAYYGFLSQTIREISK